MANQRMTHQMREKPGFIAALDQSGGSTPGALSAYGIPPDAYHGDDEMFRLMHEMRVRIMTAAAFTGDKVIGAILFEKTMDGEAQGAPVPSFLWDRGVVPFLKVDKGLEAEQDGVRLMKPIGGLDALLSRAVPLGVFGTKMRSVIEHASPSGIAAIVAQQFEIARQIAAHDLVAIVEPEVSIKSPDKAAAEALLLKEIATHLDAWPADGAPVMLKLTIPDQPDLYAPLIRHPRALRVVALSGGYSRADACQRLAKNHGMIASFSRALTEELRRDQSSSEFEDVLARTIDEIFQASTVKAG